MTWVQKEIVTAFDAQPMSGLFYLDGNMVGRRYGGHYTDGRKLPMLAFPSGEIKPIFANQRPERFGEVFVWIFKEVDLPLFADQMSAYIEAAAIAHDCGYLARRIGERAIELWGHEDSDHFLVTYDNEARRMIDVEWLVLRDIV
jgi:hypothetical protein